MVKNERKRGLEKGGNHGYVYSFPRFLSLQCLLLVRFLPFKKRRKERRFVEKLPGHLSPIHFHRREKLSDLALFTFQSISFIHLDQHRHVRKFNKHYRFLVVRTHRVNIRSYHLKAVSPDSEGTIERWSIDDDILFQQLQLDFCIQLRNILIV